jgi:hypothetical protein
MVLTYVSAGVSVLSGLVSVALLIMAVRSRRATGTRGLGWLAAAFTVFAVKSFVVAASLMFDLIGHESLELVDAIGDLATILFIVVPVLLHR